MRGCTAAAVLAAVLVAGSAAAAYAQLAVSANDAKVKLVNGKTEVVAEPAARHDLHHRFACVSTESAG